MHGWPSLLLFFSVDGGCDYSCVFCSRAHTLVFLVLCVVVYSSFVYVQSWQWAAGRGLRQKCVFVVGYLLIFMVKCCGSMRLTGCECGAHKALTKCYHPQGGCLGCADMQARGGFGFAGSMHSITT